MTDNNQHIKNFFIFLKEKEKRKIPISIKLEHFPESPLLKNEIRKLLYVPIDEYDQDRAKYINTIQKTFECVELSYYGYFKFIGNNAMAGVKMPLFYNRRVFRLFIDPQGNPSRNLDHNIIPLVHLPTYINTLLVLNTMIDDYHIDEIVEEIAREYTPSVGTPQHQINQMRYDRLSSGNITQIYLQNAISEFRSYQRWRRWRR